MEDISNTFLSSNEQTESQNIYHGFSSFAIREALCSSCIHILEDPPELLKCKIFTFENQQHGVKYLDAVTLDQAKYCEYYESNAPKDKGAGLKKETDDSGQAGIHCEVEETVTVKKKIAYQDVENVQQKLRTALSKHIQEGFSIKQVLLRKTEEISTSDKRELRNEEVLICTKTDEPK